MSIDKNQNIEEFVDSEGGMIGGGDRNPSSDSEIETGPTPKTWDDNSDYEKGISTTTDRATRYRQNIPWFAVYSYGGLNNGGISLDNTYPPMDMDSDSNEEMNNTNKVFKKRDIEEEIKEDLVKKSKDYDVWGKDYDSKTEKIIDTIEDEDLSDNQLDRIKKAVLDRINKKNA